MLALRRTFAALGAVAAVALVVGAVLAFLTFGTGQPGAAPAESPVARIIASSMASPDAPAAFKDRPTFRSCGWILLPAGAAMPADRIACLAATPDEGRELVVVTRTADDDPVVRYFRTGPDLAGIEIFEDDTADRFGDGTWHHSFCRSAQIDQSGACV
ncbi:MAG: hypothetical protein HIU86_04905 [Acidobacteria bacterium]|nr:hypothetical protein [Acidobacteriota bacterium]